MHKDIKWGNKELPGVSWDDLNKITISKLVKQEAGYAKTDFLALQPNKVRELAKPFITITQMVFFEGENQKQIRAAGYLIQDHKMPRPEWFLDTNDYKTRFINRVIDHQAIADKIDYKAKVEKTDYKAIAAKKDYKVIVTKRDQKTINAKKFKPVLQFDKQDNFIAEFSSAKEAAIVFGKPGSDDIGAVCRGKQKSAFGFIWKFKEEKK
jgi:hypothetical protein